jgi:CIC family chloride channel protein
VFRRFRLAERVPDWIKPAIGGLVVGVIALWMPQVWGIGYETIQAAINYDLTVQVLLMVIVGKAIASSFTIGSGGAGGDMAPALFIGACIGGVMGTLVNQLFPEMVNDPTLYVIAGMGAFYASIAKVPLATAILLCESTRNFTMIVPLMVANTAGFLAAGSHTIYESQHADAVRERADVLRQVPVGEICRREVVLAPAILSIQDALRLMGETGHHGFPVVDECSELIGVVSWSDMREIPYERRRDVTLGEICTREVVSLTPDASSRKALDLLDSRVISRIVIVDPDHPRHVYGIVTKEDVIRAYAARLQID